MLPYSSIPHEFNLEDEGKNFVQNFRRVEACRSELFARVIAELAVETTESKRMADRVNSGNSRRAAAVAAAAAARAAAGETDALLRGADGEDDDNDGDDGCDSDILIPAVSVSSCPTGRAAPPLSAVPAAAAATAGGSSVGRADPSPSVEGGRPIIDLRNGGDAPPAHPVGDGTSRSTGIGSERGDDARQRPRARSAAAAAAAVTERSAPPSTSAVESGGDARAAVRFLEDLILAPAGESLRSKASLRAGGGVDGGNNSDKRRYTNKRMKAEGSLAPVEGASTSSSSSAAAGGSAAATAASAAGPFAGLSICAVHLGSVTSNTIKAFTKGLVGGGGHVSTHFTPGATTHIVADASMALSWEKLNRYFSGWDDFEVDPGGAAVGAARGGRSGTPDGTPIVSSDWVSECLRRSAVVATDGFLLFPPPPGQRPLPLYEAAAGVVAAGVLARQRGSGTAGENTNRCESKVSPPAVAATAGAAAAATAAGKRKLAAVADENGAGGAAAAAGNSNPPQKLQLIAVKGGHGARDPNIGEKRHRFFCQKPPSSAAPRTVFNEEAAGQLQRLAELCATRGGHGSVFRERGFRSAARVLRNLNQQVTNIQQLEGLKRTDPTKVRGIGDSVMKELDTYYRTGKMPRVQGLEEDPRLKCLELFQKIGWVGPVKAQELYDNGLASIADVRAKGQHLLSKQARICLSRHEDITQRMPRAEAQEIEALVTRAAQSLCPGVICQACGSYRRGKSHCGDVDMLIRPPEGQEDLEMLMELVAKLKEAGFITDELSKPLGPYTPGKPQTWMGMCKLEGEGRLHRRLDIKLYPTSMYAFAVLYFTGSGHFNMSMRAFAKLKGFKLSDEGLCRVNTVNREEVHKFESISCLREQDVFDALGMNWREPKDRDEVEVQAHQRTGSNGVPEAAGDCCGGEEQENELEPMIRKQAYLERRESEELQKAILSGSVAFCSGVGGSAAAAAAVGRAAGGGGGAAEDDFYSGNDQMMQEALRRIVTDIAPTVRGARPGDGGEEEELWEELPPKLLAGGGGSGFAVRDGGGGGGDGGGVGSAGTGSEHSPVCF